MKKVEHDDFCPCARFRISALDFCTCTAYLPLSYEEIVKDVGKSFGQRLHEIMGTAKETCDV